MRTRFLSIQTIALLLLPALCSAQSVRPDTVLVAQVGEDSPVRLPGPFEVKGLASSELQPSTAQADWQRRYDSARARRRIGKVFVFAGAGAVAAGIALMYHEQAAFTDCFNDLSSRHVSGVCIEDVRPGGTLGLAGGGVLGLGLSMYFRAKGEMHRLEDQRASGGGQALWQLGDHGALAFAIARQGSTVQYRVAW